jgi:hypothetical protein
VRWLPRALPLVATLGCALDERMIAVKPEPIVVGSFENGLDADDPRFGAWSALPSGADIVLLRSTLEHDACSTSRWCLGLEWEITDPVDGVPSQAGVGNQLTALAPVDLTGYSRLVFDHQYLHQGSCAPANTLSVVLNCKLLGTAFEVGVALSSVFTTSSVDFANLTQTGPPTVQSISAQDCLRAVSALLLQIRVTLADGACAAGHLLLDNVTLRTAP